MLAPESNNCFTVDVEDYYQVSAFETRVTRQRWDQYESRVETNTQRVLEVLDRHGVQGTFFVLGWVADRYPSLVKSIHSAGHELASHGYWHQLVYAQTPEEFSDDIRKSLDAIGSVIGRNVDAYRAPSFSIVQRSLWALDILTEHGIRVDSSIFPIGGHDRYGMPGAPREIHEIPTQHGSLLEFPPSAWQWQRLNVPVGGGYFRILPLSLTLKAIRQIRRAGLPAMFYIHPWELDPEQPRVHGVSLPSRLRHYTGLHRTASRLDKLLQTFPFSTVSQVLSENQPIRQESSRNLQGEELLATTSVGNR